MTLYQKLLSAGLAHDIAHHESDLYVVVSPQSTKIIYEWLLENNYLKEAFLSVFTDQINGKRTYDIPFQYDPWWVKKLAHHQKPEWASFYDADWIRTVKVDGDKKANYEVIFQINGVRRYCRIPANTVEEALGVFFTLHPDVTYEDVIDHCEV